MNGIWQQVERQVAPILGRDIHFSDIQAVGGGCINQAWKVTDSSGHHWFVKSNHAHLFPMFEAEFEGLELLYKTGSIRVPKPIHCDKVAHHSYLLLEYIPLQGRAQPRLAGEQLASLHQTQADVFGWFIHNTIGSTQQRNTQHSDWLYFWQHERLRFQLDLALHKGLPQNIYEDGFELSENLSAFFSGYQPKASLLHGDLWSGNLAYDDHNQPVIFDPAVYYGDHETDLAMTELFGGFGEFFYASYNEHYPIDSGYRTRKTLYNLYHILNHFNLFGGGYGAQSGRMINQLLSEIR